MPRPFGFGRCRRRRGAASFSPVSIFTGGALGLIYDPTDTATMFQSGTRAAPGSASVADGVVGLLLDKSGNNNDATAAGIGRPLYRSTSGVSSLDFDGVDDGMTLPTGLLTGWTSGTAIFASKKNIYPPANGTTAGPVLGDFGSSSSYYPFTDGTIYDSFLTSTRKDTAVDPGNFAAWHVGDFRSALNNWKAAFNGTDYYTTATNTVAVGTAPFLGKGVNGGAVQYLGRIGRLIIVNRVLTGAELANARTWVGAGAGVIL